MVQHQQDPTKSTGVKKKAFIKTRNQEENYAPESFKHISQYFKPSSHWFISHMLWNSAYYEHLMNNVINQFSYRLGWLNFWTTKRMKIFLKSQLSQIEWKYFLVDLCTWLATNGSSKKLIDTKTRVLELAVFKNNLDENHQFIDK